MSEKSSAALLTLLVLLHAGCAHKIQQTYYLGVFDPDEQVPSAVYRVTVSGEADAISNTKFASGWVPAGLVDSLGSDISMPMDKNGVKITAASKEAKTKLQTGRRMVAFGPEGFREAPADHRLVIVMGSSPEAFFKAIDEGLKAYAGATAERRQEGLQRALFEALIVTREESRRLAELERDVAVQLPAEGGAR